VELTPKKLNKKIIFAILGIAEVQRASLRLNRSKFLVDISGSMQRWQHVHFVPANNKRAIAEKFRKDPPRGEVRTGIYFTGCATDLVYG
jgi:hypothetical protein